MAIENALIAKIGGGLVAVGSVGGVGYACKDAIIKLLWQTNPYYLVVQVKENTTDKPTEELYAEDKTTKKEKKNFKCQYDTNESKKEVTDCELIELKFVENSKSLSFDQINNSSELIKKQDLLVKDTYFKLRMDLNKLSNIKYDDDTFLIDLIPTKEDEKAKKYSQLKVIAKIDENKVKTTNNQIIVKLEENSINASSVTDHKCFIGNAATTTDSQKIACKIYKFTPKTGTSNGVIAFEAKPTEVTDWTTSNTPKESYYVIDFSDETKKEELLKKVFDTKTQIIYQNTDVSKIAKFTFLKSFVGKYKETTDTSNKAFIF